MKKPASIVVEGKDFVKDIETTSVDQILPFEPYYKLGNLIEHLFSAKQLLNREISQEYWEKITIKCHKNIKDVQTALQPNPIAYEEECSRIGGSDIRKCVALFRTMRNSQKKCIKTLRDFELEFSRFSIFCGRNPMVIEITIIFIIPAAL